ncbi:MAG: hypothetical protein IJM30_07260 [Thermoguttaceae bacterium]|nr:hypothetical protein [Thermoguttaceae bacterium]
MESRTFYLVDYENVRDAGISGGGVKSNDQVYLFASAGSGVNFNSQKLYSYGLKHINQVLSPSLDQCVDKLILAYLGYFMGTEDPLTKYVIISKDKGFDPAIEILKGLRNVSIERREQIAPEKTTAKKQDPEPSSKTAANKPDAQPKKATAESPAKTKEKPEAKAPESRVAPMTQSEFHVAVQRALGEKKFPPNEAGPIASTLNKLYKTPEFPNNVKSELKERFPNYNKIFQAIYPAIREYKQSVEASGQSTPPPTEKQEAPVAKAEVSEIKPPPKPESAPKLEEPVAKVEPPRAVPQPAPDPKPALERQVPEAKIAEVPKVGDSLSAIKQDLSAAIHKVLASSNNYETPRVGKIAKAICARCGQDNFLTVVLNDLRAIDEDGINMFSLIVNPVLIGAQRRVEQLKESDPSYL